MMSYFTTSRHDHLREQVREFAEGVLRPLVPEMEAARTAHPELARLIARQGWIGVTIGREHGGMGLGHLAKTVVVEELSRVSAAAGAIAQASQLGTAMILHFGSDEQKAEWLPAIARGDCLPTIAVTEQESGSHVLGIEATAERDGDDYVINGSKAYIGNSHVGTLHCVVARTGGGRGGLSAFLVEAGRAGLSLARQEPAMGLHGFSFGGLVFSGCRVPAASRLGEEGDGLAAAYSSSVLYGRPNLTAVALGIHRAVVEETVAFALGRERYGSPLSSLPPVEQRIGEMQSRLMTARLLAYHAAHMLDAGEACDPELVNAKLVNAEYAVTSARDAMEVHGAAGLLAGRPVERYLRDALHTCAPAGTSAVQRLRLAQAALGKDKGSWSQRFAGAPAGADGAPPPTALARTA